MTVTRDDCPGFNSVTVIRDPLTLTLPNVAVALQPNAESKFEITAVKPSLVGVIEVKDARGAPAILDPGVGVLTGLTLCDGVGVGVELFAKSALPMIVAEPDS